jgi:hypothetical protein
MDLIADTTFLVGLWRRQPWAMDFATAHPGKTLGISWMGAVPAYARIASALQENHPDVYPAIGQNDLWIAAVAVHTGLPLLTRNRRHLDRIDGLSLHVLDSGFNG